MTPKEKAKELVESFIDALTVKDCALIAVNEIINVLNGYWNQDCKINNTKIGYYEEVKKEIEKL